MSKTLTITTPDDWHLHVRDAAAMAAVVPHTAARFARAIIMPNLKPPVVATEQAIAYRNRILQTLPEGHPFNPLMTLYLTDNTPPDEIHSAKRSGQVVAVKYYPAGATTNAQDGVTDIRNTYATLAALEEAALPLLVHGEVTDPGVDVFDREKYFIDRVLEPLTRKFPQLRIVFEHITTSQAVEFVASQGEQIAATITPQHLLFNRNELFNGGIRPHYYCLPVLKRESHRAALLAAATSGNPKYFLGTDSAPHSRLRKETACGCAGIYSAHAGIELYAQIFEGVDALDKLEGFASYFGADFYRLDRNTTQITLQREAWQVPQHYPMGNDELIPLLAGEYLDWRLVTPS